MHKIHSRATRNNKKQKGKSKKRGFETIKNLEPQITAITRIRKFSFELISVFCPLAVEAKIAGLTRNDLRLKNIEILEVGKGCKMTLKKVSGCLSLKLFSKNT